MQKSDLFMVIFMLFSLMLGAQSWTELTQWTPGDGSDNFQFGSSVSMSDEFAVVGVRYATHDVANAGCAYVYQWDGADWTECAILYASDYETNAYFGTSVSVWGNYIIVGSPGESTNGENAGCAYIFHWDGSNWSEQDIITPADNAAGDFFGFSVSIRGDYAIIGAPYADFFFADQGSAYLYTRSGTDWAMVDKFTAANPAISDYYGISVSMGVNYAAVGCPYSDDGASYTGNAFIYYPVDSSWELKTKLLAPDIESGDRFGISVAMSDNYLAVGSLCDIGSYASAGAVYIYHLDSGEWTYETILSASNPAQNDLFGYAVSLRDDKAIVGAYSKNSSAGAAYIYGNNGSGWSEETVLTASDAAANDRFGFAVAIQGEYAVVGAYGKASSAGAAYLFGPATSLPVTLTSFSATQTYTNSTLICWVTQSESDMAGYNVLRNTVNDAGDAVFLNERLIPAGNSPEERSYRIEDPSVVLGQTYYYWLEGVDLDGTLNVYGPVSLTLTPHTEEGESTPELTACLHGCFPNPFNPSTSINFSLEQDDSYHISIFNPKGQQVKSYTGIGEKGLNHIVWNGEDDDGKPVASGLYLIRMHSGSYLGTQKAILLK